MGKLKIFSSMILALSLLIAIFNLIYVAKLVLYPYSTDYSNAIPYYMALSTLYKSFNTYPYLITYYPPLYYLMFDALKPYVQSPALPYLLERLMSSAAYIISTILIYLISFKATKSVSESALSSMLFLSAFSLTANIIFSNPSIFELCFDLLAVLILLNRRNNYIAYTAISLSIAFLFKQSGILFLLASITYLLYLREKQSAIKLALYFSVIIIPIMILANILSDGRFIFSLFIIPFITPFSPTGIISTLLQLIIFTPIFAIVLPIIYFTKDVINHKIFFIILLCFSMINIITTAKFGSNIGYTLPTIAIASVLSAPYIRQLSNSEKKSSIIINIIRWAILFSLISALVVVYINTSQVTYPNNLQQARSVINGIKGNILTDNPAFAFESNKSLLFEPSIFWTMQNSSIWNDSKIIASISRHNFSAIVFYRDQRFYYYNGLINAINKSYVMKYNFSGLYIYLPKNSTN